MAFLVSVALFAYFWLIGFALLGVLGRQDDLVRNVLIAPAAGMITLVYATYLPSRAGLSAASFAMPVTLILLVVAVAALAWRRPRLPGYRGLPYLLLLPLALAASGWPLFENGFTWLSHFNPDAAHYMADTQRLVQYSYAGTSGPVAWREQTDWSSYYVVYALINQRIATDLVFAWAVAVTGLDEPAMYMPLIVAWHVGALAAAAALIGARDRFARLLSAGLLAVAALSTVGVSSQLLGQELGLACLALAAVLLLAPFYRLAWPALRRHIALTAAVMAGFVLSYPEMLPFLGLSFLVYHGLRIRDLLQCWRKAVLAGVAIGIGAMLLIAPDGIGLLGFLFGQVGRAGGKMQYAALFPYFLVPSGIAALWGLASYSRGIGALLSADAAIAIGLVLTIAAFAAAVWLSWRREASAAIVLVMAVLGTGLLAGQIGFGIFKLAMFAQPFLMPMMVLALCRLLRVAR